jgi:hypothetical protein
MHLKKVPLKKYQCLSESVEAVRAFIMIGGGNPMVKARRTARAVFVLLGERDNMTGLLYQVYEVLSESYVFDSRNISAPEVPIFQVTPQLTLLKVMARCHQ